MLALTAIYSGNIVEVLVDHLPGDGAIDLHLELDVFACRGGADQVIDGQHLQSDGAVSRLKSGFHCGAVGRVQVLRPAEAGEVCRVDIRPVTGHPGVPAAIEWEITAARFSPIAAALLGACQRSE